MTISSTRPPTASWLRFCPPQKVLVKGKTVLDPVEIEWWGMFMEPEFPQLDGDIVHRVEEKDRIDKLAAFYYGNERLWWVIAARNDMDDPTLELKPESVGDRPREIIIPSPGYIQQNLLRRKVGSGR